MPVQELRAQFPDTPETEIRHLLEICNGDTNTVGRLLGGAAGGHVAASSHTSVPATPVAVPEAQFASGKRGR